MFCWDRRRAVYLCSSLSSDVIHNTCNWPPPPPLPPTHPYPAANLNFARPHSHLPSPHPPLRPLFYTLCKFVSASLPCPCRRRLAGVLDTTHGHRSSTHAKVASAACAVRWSISALPCPPQRTLAWQVP
ncbi:hypothetical protein LPMP_311840 [Leishmania panamensis]|uniref:Uncharacterized protein n=1 Tax=Leishmania panamensis TaxID=5679 RepID=A0A088RZR4_LEIPA|nr:hypothetical protein LPMP_311840 [Leishmania panamensis]AIO00775.1 hypothetical protein LPMP_311840 [Leishmania panamensis]